MSMVSLHGDPRLDRAIGTYVTIDGVVTDEPDVREASVRVALDARALIVGSSTLAMSSGILAVAQPHTEIAYGDRVRVSGMLEKPQAFDTGLGRQFNYPAYLAKDGILYQISNARIERTGGNVGNPLKAAAIKAKQIYLRGTDAVLPDPEAGLAGGITVGDKRSIGPQLSADFQKVSLIHMVVLSGYNITVVVNAIGKVLSWAPRSVRFGGSALGVVFFILMSGGAASAMRAGLMAIIAMYARQSGRVFVASRALAAVSFGMIMWNPMTLSFDPSFQLSALATVGLIAFTPIFDRHMRWLTERGGLREIAASTMGTQLAVLPLLLYQNGNLSIVALPANLLALMPVPLAMFFSFVAAVGGIFLGPLATPLAFPAYALLRYIISVAKFFASLPFASFGVPAFSSWWLLAAYGILAAGVLWSRKGLETEASS